jgi:transcriptional regulator with XRE-family HTH domain
MAAPKNETFGERLLRAIKARGLSRNKAGQKAGLAPGHITKLINGKGVGVAPETIQRLSKALRVNYEWLATGEGAMDDGSPLPPSVDVDEPARVFGDLPGWEEAEAEARKLFDEIPSDAFEAARQTSAPRLPELVDATTVGKWAMTWFEQMSREDRLKAERDAIHARAQRIIEDATRR